MRKEEKIVNFLLYVYPPTVHGYFFPAGLNFGLVHSAKHIMLPRVHYIRGFQIDDCVFQRGPNFANLRNQVYYPEPR